MGLLRKLRKRNKSTGSAASSVHSLSLPPLSAPHPEPSIPHTSPHLSTLLPSASIASLSLDPSPSASLPPVYTPPAAPIPLPDDDDASSDSSDDFEDAEEASEAAVDVAREGVLEEKGDPQHAAESARPQGAERRSRLVPLAERDPGSLSKAARLVLEKLEEPLPARRRLNKPPSALTAQDVALTEAELREDVQGVWKALHLFLSSRIDAAQEICLSQAHRLYFSVGYSLITSIKALATFEPEDLETAIQCCRDSTTIAHLLRKKDHGLFERVGSIAKGSTSVHSIRAMSLVQRHAELVYAECTLLKAVLGIIYSQSFTAFVKEALNMRSAYAIYRTLAKYVEIADAAAPAGHDATVDEDFRSGVLLGNGMISLILSLLPSAVLGVMAVFGFTGDRDYGLQMLMRAGGWKAGRKEPSVEPENEGLRRSVCDMILLMFHLVIATYLPVGGVDVDTASNILNYELDRYPTGIFFLYFAGRLHATETRLDEATESFHLAIESQRDFKQLAHICHWDLFLVALAQGEWMKGYDSVAILNKESKWSPSVYAYSEAITLYESNLKPDQAAALMRRVPTLTQKIGGKSIPLEKFVSRRARKFVSQGNRLALPGLEAAYVLNCLAMSPIEVLHDKYLKQVTTLLEQLEAVSSPAEYGQSGDECIDDFCLVHFLRAVVLRHIAHPEPHIKVVGAPPISVEEADELALLSLNTVLKHGRDLHFDHHLVLFTHYELGRLYAAQGAFAQARAEYEIVLSDKGLEMSAKKGKGKVTLQNMAVLRSNAGLGVLKEAGH